MQDLSLPENNFGINIDFGHQNQQGRHNDMSKSQKSRNLHKLIELHAPAIAFAQNIGLKPRVIEYVDDRENIPEFKIKIIKSNESIEINALEIKDAAYISDRNYAVLRTEANLRDRLPSLYRVKDERSKINEIFTIIESNQGVRIDARKKIEMFAGKFFKDGFFVDGDLVIKFSGDSTNISQAHKLTNFTFSFINFKKRNEAQTMITPNSAAGSFIIGIFEVENECYNELAVKLADTFQDIHNLNSVIIDGQEIMIQKRFGGDMKFLGIMYGILAANSNHPCPWCTCHKDEFGDLSKDWSLTVVDNNRTGARTLENANKYFNEKKSKYSYRDKPLISIEFQNCVIDLLHLFLRVSDNLFSCFSKNLYEADKNNSDNLSKRPNLKIFVNFLKNECKIYNSYFMKNSSLKFRTFNERELFKIFEKCILSLLFPTMTKIIEITSLWNDFFFIYRSLKENEFESLENLKEQLHHWLNLFKICYPSDFITPYMHAFVVHIPEFIQIHGNLNLFSLQGLEKLNDITTQNFHRSSNKKENFLVQMLQKRNRQELYSLNLV